MDLGLTKYLLICIPLCLTFIKIPESAGIPIYQTPDARFSSGDAHPRILKPDGNMIMKTWFNVGNGWIPRTSALRDIDFSQTAFLEKDTALRAKPDGSTPPQAVLKAKTRVIILARKDSWIQVKTETAYGWLAEDTLQPNPFDGGFVETRKSVSLSLFPNLKSRKSVNVPQGIKLKPLAIKEAWILVKYKNTPGWMTFDNVFSRVDFATYVLPKGIKTIWKKVLPDYSKGHKYAPQGPWFKTDTNQWLNLTQIRGIITDSKKILVTEKTPVRSVPSFGHSEVKGFKKFGDIIPSSSVSTISWMHTLNRDTGSVWWPLYPVGTEDGESKQDLNTNQIFSRNIFDLAEHPKEPHFKVVSTQGIYKTTDEKNWKKIEFFGSQNYPVAISPRGEIYVGGYRSTSQGDTFSPYLRWDRVLARLSQRHSLAPQKLRLTKIEFQEHSKDGQSNILITVNSGIQDPHTKSSKIRLKSTDGGLNWDYAPEKSAGRFDLAQGLSMNDGQ